MLLQRILAGIKPSKGNNQPPLPPNTVLYLPMDGADNGTVFTDLVGAPVTNVGATTRAVVKRYGISSGYFTNGAYLSLPNSPNYVFGTGDFTIELSFNISSIPGIYDGSQGAGLVFFGEKWARNGKNNWALALYRDSGTPWSIIFAGGLGNSFSIAVPYSPPLNTMVDLIVMRKAGTLYFIVNKKIIATRPFTAAVTNVNPSAVFLVGRLVGGDSASVFWNFTGYIDDLIVTNAAKYAPTDFP